MILDPAPVFLGVDVVILVCRVALVAIVVFMASLLIGVDLDLNFNTFLDLFQQVEDFILIAEVLPPPPRLT